MELAFMLPAIIGGFIWLMVIFSLMFLLPLLLIIYFFADNPKGVISKLMTWEFWIAGVITLLFSLGMGLNEIMKAVGFSEFSEGADLDLIRWIIIGIAMGGIIFMMIPLKFDGTIFDLKNAEKKDENKNYGSFIEHTLVTITAGIIGFVKIGLIVYLFNYLLSFVLRSENTDVMDFNDFIIPFGSIFIPLAVIGGFLYGVMHKKMDFIRPSDMPFLQSLRSILSFLAIIGITIGLGGLVNHILSSTLSEYGNWDLDTIRVLSVTLIMSLITFGIASMHSPCARWMKNKICKNCEKNEKES